MPCESPPPPHHNGFRHYYEDSAYGGAYSANYQDDSVVAGPSDNSGYNTGSDTDWCGQYLECPQAFEPFVSPRVVDPLAISVKTENSDDDDVIYVETVPARLVIKPSIDLD